MPASRALPIQFTPFNADHFKSPEGVALVNLQMSQIVDAVNANNGAAGPVLMPNGVDVNGSTITGLGSPQSPSDAVSLEHASTSYGAPAVSPDLDIGGKNTLKGLAYCYQQVSQINSLIKAGGSGTVTLAKLTTGGTNGSITFARGLMQSFVNPT